MAKAKIALRLNDQTPDQKAANAHTINGLMANHVLVFATSNPALTAYNTAALNVDSRLSTIATMEQNLETERSLLRESVATLDDLTTQLADYVENIANGNGATMQLAGFQLANAPVPIGQLPPPQDLRGFTASIDGTVDLRWKRVRGAKSYFVECAANPSGPWAQIDVTRRVRAIGTAGYSGWSDPAQKMAA